MSIEKAKHFWNGWDLKTLITYGLIVGGFVVSQIRNDERMGIALQYLTKEQEEVKQTVKSIWQIIGALKEDVRKAEGINDQQQKDIDKHDRKLYPN